MRILFLALISIGIWATNFETVQPENEYLEKVLHNLNKIKSATYYSTGIASAPEDTIGFSEPRTQYIKIFINPSDTLVGASSAIYAKEDTTKMTDFYDGKVRGKINWDEEYVQVDSFQHHPYPFRLVHYPFYTKIQEIIKYALTTEDSIKTAFQDYGDSVRFSLKIYNQHVYFHIKPIVIKNEYIPDDEISQFDIWIRKTDDLPYRMRSKWHHLTVFEECYDAEFNTTHEVAFHSEDYFPEHFGIAQFKRGERKPNIDLEGKVAPAWELSDLSNHPVRLKDLKSKVLMLQFTGVGCGPCHHSVPFLKQLVEEYKEKDFEFVSIETWSDNIDGLKRYRDRNGMNFKFLNANDSIKSDYAVQAVPVFYILDEKRVIRKVIRGYGKGTTDQEIRNTINELI